MSDNQALIPVIVLAVYLIAEVLKTYVVKTDDQKKILPIFCGAIGAVIGSLLYFFYPACLGGMDFTGAIINGAFSGFAATGCNQIYKQIKKYIESKDDSKDSISSNDNNDEDDNCDDF